MTAAQLTGNSDVLKLSHHELSSMFRHFQSKISVMEGQLAALAPLAISLNQAVKKALENEKTNPSNLRLDAGKEQAAPDSGGKYVDVIVIFNLTIFVEATDSSDARPGSQTQHIYPQNNSLSKWSVLKKSILNEVRKNRELTEQSAVDDAVVAKEKANSVIDQSANANHNLSGINEGVEIIVGEKNIITTSASAITTKGTSMEASVTNRNLSIDDKKSSSSDSSCSPNNAALPSSKVTTPSSANQSDVPSPSSTKPLVENNSVVATQSSLVLSLKETIRKLKLKFAQHAGEADAKGLTHSSSEEIIVTIDTKKLEAWKFSKSGFHRNSSFCIKWDFAMACKLRVYSIFYTCNLTLC
jgi:hypothetical protein